MDEARPVPPLRIFVSYSHKDDKMCERFLDHLSELKREGLIAPWSDRLITPGSEWAGAIDENLNSAHIIVLLVSPDFLASDYSNDVEMDRAMERHQKGEAQVVPLILKPCDWKTSRFAKLQAIPARGKPVVDWRTRDHGFEDAVSRLRRMIHDICTPPPLPIRVVRSAVGRHPWRWSIGTAVAVALLAGSWLWSKSSGYLKQGTDLLNVGRYQAALPYFQQARKWNPFSRAAGCGSAAVELDAARSHQVTFEQRLGEAARQFPHCAYLKVLSGDFKYANGDRQGAFADYQEAVKREPRLAEAYFDMGRILDVEGSPDEALEPYKKAAELSKTTPAYHNNLADLYFRRQEYDKAIEEYGKVANFPFSALQAAKIYRLQQNLDDASGREEDAIRCLKDLAQCLPETDQQQAEQTQAWAFDVSPTQQVRLTQVEEKQCYAELESALTEYLKGNEGVAATTVPAAIGGVGKCHSRRRELSNILKWELRRLGSEVSKFTNASDAFATRYLDSSRAPS